MGWGKKFKVPGGGGAGGGEVTGCVPPSCARVPPLHSDDFADLCRCTLRSWCLDGPCVSLDLRKPPNASVLDGAPMSERVLNQETGFHSDFAP